LLGVSVVLPPSMDQALQRMQALGTDPSGLGSGGGGSEGLADPGASTLPTPVSQALWALQTPGSQTRRSDTGTAAMVDLARVSVVGAKCVFVVCLAR
jgi:hypothetical protein